MDITNQIETNVCIELVKSSPTKRCVFLSAGAMKQMPDGKTKPNFLVEIDGKQLGYIPNKTSLKKLAEAWGAETTKWMGKQVTFEIGQVNNKDAIIAKPAN